jgi:hypothetical protein
MKFCPVVPEICCGQVHGPQKERKKEKEKNNNNNKKRSKNNKSCLGDLINYLFYNLLQFYTDFLQRI